MLDVEVGFISKLLQTKDIMTVKDSQIKLTHFTGDNKVAYQYIYDTFMKTGEVPTVRAFKRKFPHYPLEMYRGEVGTEENLLYWCQELRVKTKHNELADLVDVVASKLQDFHTEEAYSEIKKAEQPKETKPNENFSINKSEFFKGVKFALDELAKGKTAEEILTAL